jgi:hypothetical protein
VCTEVESKIRNAKNAFQNLDRCSNEKRVSLYANFALIHLWFELKAIDLNAKVKGLKEPQEY